MTNSATSSFNLLIKNSADAIAIVDTNLQIICCSTVWQTNLDVNQDTIVGKFYYDVDPDADEFILKTFDNCLSNGINNSKEVKLIKSNSTIQWTKWSISPWHNELESIGGLVITRTDISNEKRREEILLKAEKVARIGGWEIDMRSGKTFWTDVTKEIHEVPLDFDPNIEEGINFYKKGHSRDEITRLVSEAIAHGKPYDTELQLVTAKGNELWVRAKGETELLNGNCIRIYGTFQDIDERKRTSLEYQKVSNRLTIATDAAHIGIWEYNLISSELVWDDNMFSIYKVDKSSFDGHYETWKKTVHPKDLLKNETALAQAIAGKKKFDIDFRIIWPDGSIRYIKGRGSVIQDENNKPIKMIGANWDITELKTTKLKLIRNNQSFNGVFDKSTIGMILTNSKGEFEEVNRSFCHSIGFTPEELIGKNILEFTIPEDVQESKDKINALASGETSSIQLEKRFRHKNGKIIYVLIVGTSVYDINGNPSNLIGQVLDITSRIESEKQLQTLVEVTKGQNSSLMNFAHIVSHNLRSHATNMAMLIKFLRKENSKAEKENIEAMLFKAVDSLNETVLHLNDVVLIKTGALDKMKSKSLISAVNSAKDTLSVLIKEKEATCYLNICKTHFVNVVPAYINSIFLNLLSNSLKYASPDRKPVIEITSRIKKDFIEVTFKDNGQGIDLVRHGGKIFGMYKTFHNNKDAKGIGLFITKNQIEAMFGTITIDSELNKGTTFTIKLKKI